MVLFENTMIGEGAGNTGTLWLPVQPVASVTVTVKTLGEELGVTVMVWVVWPLFHKYETPPPAVKVVDVPWQTTAGPFSVAFGGS